MTTAPDPAPDPAGTLAGVMRLDRGRILSALIARTGDFQLAEDAIGDAGEAALVHWNRSGIPATPVAWLIRVAFRKAIDRLRRRKRDERGVAALAVLARDEAEEDPEVIADERLRLIFTCCHPALDPKTRVALTLRTLGGLTTAEIARAFLDRESAMAQRLVRARAKIKAAGIPFAIPGPELWAERLHSVLTVIYLIFNEGYWASSGASPLRVSLCEEAIFLARMLDGLQPGEAETEGLLALMLLSHARAGARQTASGSFVPLQEQNRNLWDHAMISEGTEVLDRAVARQQRGSFQIQAAISALHLRAGAPQATDWRQILLLYDALLALEPSPVIELNRAVALAEAGQLATALAILARLEPMLPEYQPFHAAKAALLARHGDRQPAIAAFDRAISLSVTPAEIGYLSARRAELLG